MEAVLNYVKSGSFWGSLIVIVLTVVILNVIKKYLIKKVAYTNRDEQHKNTLLGVLFNVLQYLVVIVAAIIVLKLHGINVVTIFAGLGIVATIIGLSLQDSLKDIFAGINIYNNNFYKVGDIVNFQGNMCEVKYFNARVTKFRNIMSNSTYTVCNSQINAIEKLKDTCAVLFPFEFETEKKKIEKILSGAAKEIDAIRGVSNVRYIGIADISTVGVFHGIVFEANPKRHIEVKLALYNYVYDQCIKEGIAIADDNTRYVNFLNHLDVKNKK